MVLLSICVRDKFESIMSQLQQQYNKVNNSNLSLEIEEVKGTDSNFIVCNIDDKNSNLGYLSENLRLTTINVLTDFIINEYEDKIINRIINTNYGYFNAAEKREIQKLSLKNLDDINNDNILNSLYIIRRKNIITRKLIEYFENNDTINIDGFITFRLNDYIKELENIVEKAVDDYLMEREYREFIKLLKYFVEVQESKLEVIHVLVGSDNKYILLDEYEREITNQCIEDFMNEVRDGEINYDDLLVSSLITLAPKSIVIHGVQNMVNHELLDTIKSVFIGKVKLCEGCKSCISNKLITEKSPK